MIFFLRGEEGGLLSCVDAFLLMISLFVASIYFTATLQLVSGELYLQEERNFIFTRGVATTVNKL